MTTKRQCYFIPIDQHDENGWIPSLVTEGEPGHAPLTGKGAFASPWYWGKTYEAAKALAAKMNREDFGLSEADVVDIVASSIGAGGVVRLGASGSQEDGES